MTSSLPRRHGAISAFIRNPIARKPPPKPSRPNTRLERLKDASAKAAATRKRQGEERAG
jgi:hypothetical protein